MIFIISFRQYLKLFPAEFCCLKCKCQDRSSPDYYQHESHPPFPRNYFILENPILNFAFLENFNFCLVLKISGCVYVWEQTIARSGRFHCQQCGVLDISLISQSQLERFLCIEMYAQILHSCCPKQLSAKAFYLIFSFLLTAF